MLLCLHVSVSLTIRNASVTLKKLWMGSLHVAIRLISLKSYGCLQSAYADHLRILIVRTHVPFPPCPCNREVANMPRGPKVTRESIEEMVEMVRENRSLYDPTCEDHMDATMSNNIWHSIPQCPITCSMFPALFSETLCNTRSRPI